MVGKAQHIISSGMSWKFIRIFKDLRWSSGSFILSQISKNGIQDFGGKGKEMTCTVERVSMMDQVLKCSCLFLHGIHHKIQPILHCPYLYFLLHVTNFKLTRLLVFPSGSLTKGIALDLIFSFKTVTSWKVTIVTFMMIYFFKSLLLQLVDSLLKGLILLCKGLVLPGNSFDYGWKCL